MRMNNKPESPSVSNVNDRQYAVLEAFAKEQSAESGTRIAVIKPNGKSLVFVNGRSVPLNKGGHIAAEEVLR